MSFESRPKRTEPVSNGTEPRFTKLREGNAVLTEQERLLATVYRYAMFCERKLATFQADADNDRLFANPEAKEEVTNVLDTLYANLRALRAEMADLMKVSSSREEVVVLLAAKNVVQDLPNKDT